MTKIRFYRATEANMLLGSLYTKPSLFDTPQMDAITEADFPNKMHKIAYSIMSNLYSIGHSKFTQGVIQSYINGRPQLSEYFYESTETESGEVAPVQRKSRVSTSRNLIRPEPEVKGIRSSGAP